MGFKKAGNEPWYPQTYDGYDYNYKYKLVTELWKRAIPFPKNANLACLRQLLMRSDRWVLDYDKYSTEALKAMIEQRQLEVPPTGRKAVIVARLKQADENATFSKFMDLPPELRVRIYEAYFNTVFNGNRGNGKRGYEAPSQPFLARASCLLRTEVLPVYYNTCRFVIAAEYIRETRDAQHWQFSAPTQAWLGNTSIDSLARVTRLRFQVTWRLRHSQKATYTHVDVDIPMRGKKGGRVEVAEQPTCWKTEWRQQEIAGLTERLVGGIVEEIAERPGTSRLRKDDIEAMIVAMERAHSATL